MFGFVQRKGKQFKQESKEMWSEVSHFAQLIF